MASSIRPHGIVFFDGDLDGDGACWSALGLAPGFRGSATKTVEEFGAPPTWQVVSLAKKCGGNMRITVQHEAQHVLGRVGCSSGSAPLAAALSLELSLGVAVR